MAKIRGRSKCGISLVFTQDPAQHHSLQKFPPPSPSIGLIPPACAPEVRTHMPRSGHLRHITTRSLGCVPVFLLAHVLLESRAVSYSSNPGLQSQRVEPYSGI